MKKIISFFISVGLLAVGMPSVAFAARIRPDRE